LTLEGNGAALGVVLVVGGTQICSRNDVVELASESLNCRDNASALVTQSVRV
jgi:hypothetical protein